MNPPKAGTLLVPIIECAYSHTGGWFYDRESGSTAGVRVILQIVGIDIAAGDIVYRYKQDYKHIVSPYQSAISIHVADSLFKDFADQLKAKLAPGAFMGFSMEILAGMRPK